MFAIWSLKEAKLFYLTTMKKGYLQTKILNWRHVFKSIFRFSGHLKDK